VAAAAKPVLISLGESGDGSVQALAISLGAVDVGSFQFCGIFVMAVGVGTTQLLLILSAAVSEFTIDTQMPCMADEASGLGLVNVGPLPYATSHLRSAVFQILFHISNGFVTPRLFPQFAMKLDIS
jgi:hypothetical protein